jgi:hypothetical protein
MTTKDYIYKSTIKETYGLTDSWIKRLGEPDRVVPNPHYRSKNSYLYARARVEAYIEEHQAEYNALLAGRAKRSERAKKAADHRANEMIEWASRVRIEIDRLPRRDRLERQAEETFYEFRSAERGDYDATFTPTDNAIIAHVRHTRTNYEYLLSQIEGKPGCHEAYLIIRERVDTEIAGVLT